MKQVDQMLSLLRNEPLPLALGTIEVSVMAGLAAGRERVAGRRGFALACGVAAVVGLWGGLSTPASSLRDSRAEPVLGVPAAAPSHLLAF
ncbi:hypothetical protein [Novosphingobium sp.]|uniref:hypothetical protein n=1 Tax=Novosphingobium sp. TaxID=1874826 RepID=UPI0028AFD1FD|nr:hypothetical protein [Novosphingobium sp.]